jgi:hypothetical protein
MTAHPTARDRLLEFARKELPEGATIRGFAAEPDHIEIRFLLGKIVVGLDLTDGETCLNFDVHLMENISVSCARSFALALTAAVEFAGRLEARARELEGEGEAKDRP